MKKNTCPNGGSEQFLTEPNQYDILKFNNRDFEIEDTQIVDDATIYCCECSNEIDQEKSLQQKQVVLKTPKNEISKPLFPF